MSSETRAIVTKLGNAMKTDDYATVQELLSEAKIRFGAANGCIEENVIPFAGTYADVRLFFRDWLSSIAVKNFDFFDLIVDGEHFAMDVSLDVIVHATGKVYPFTSIYKGYLKNGKIAYMNLQTDTYQQFRALETTLKQGKQ